MDTQCVSRLPISRSAQTAKDALRKTPNMSTSCMRVFLDIDEMIGTTSDEHAQRCPRDPLIRVIQRRRWTADKPGAVDLVAMHIDWRSDCRHMIAHTTLSHCLNMLARQPLGADCRAVLSAHVANDDGATKAWLQVYLEPVSEGAPCQPQAETAIDDMACETLPLAEPSPCAPPSPLPKGSAASDVAVVRHAVEIARQRKERGAPREDSHPSRTSDTRPATTTVAATTTTTTIMSTTSAPAAVAPCAVATAKGTAGHQPTSTISTVQGSFCTTSQPAQTPADIVALYPTMTLEDAGRLFAAENQLVGVVHHWVAPATLASMRAKTISVSLHSAPAAMARAVGDHAGLRDRTKKIVLSLCKDKGTPRVLCAIVDVLPGPETQSPAQVAALYPFLSVRGAMALGGIAALLRTVPHVWVARWPDCARGHCTRLSIDTMEWPSVADYVCDSTAAHKGSWLVLCLDRANDGTLCLYCVRASPAH